MTTMCSGPRRTTCTSTDLFQPEGESLSTSEDPIWCRQIPRDELVVSSEWRSAAVLATSSAIESRLWNSRQSLLHLPHRKCHQQQSKTTSLTTNYYEHRCVQFCTLTEQYSLLMTVITNNVIFKNVN